MVPLPGVTPTWLRERLDPDVLVIHCAVRIVPLKSDGAMAKHTPCSLASAIPICRLGPLHHFFIVELDGHGIVLHYDVLGEPLVILRDSLDVIGAHILNVIQAAALYRIPLVGVVHLDLK